VSWGLDLREESVSRSRWPRRRRLGSIGFAILNNGSNTIEAYFAVVVDIGMKHLSKEAHAWRFRGILFRKH
jgi:hypothetical protein